MVSWRVCDSLSLRMTSRSHTRKTLPQASPCAASLAAAILSCICAGASNAGTIVRANTPGANGMGASNAAIPATFGDNIALSAPGNAVFETYANGGGTVGTPDIGLTWSATGGSNNNRWEFHTWGGATVANSGGGALQMDGSSVSSTFSITFTPNASSAVMLKSFNFVGDTNGDTYQYRIDVVNTASGEVVQTQSTALWTTATGQNPGTNGTYAGAPAIALNFSGNTGTAYRLDLTRIAGSGSAVNIAIDNLDFDQIPADPGLPPVLTNESAGPSAVIALAADDFTFTATDPEGQAVQIQIDWGDGRSSDWTASGASGEPRIISRAYPHSGQFTIRARARDLLGGTSDWLEIQGINVQAAAGIPDGLAGLWDFANPADIGKATYGSDLIVVGTTPTHSATVADGAPEPHTLAGVVTTAAGTANRLLAAHGIGANGNGQKANRHTLVFDVRVPATAQWRSFYQTALANNIDAHYFVRNTDNRLGRTTITYSSQPIPADRWVRLAISVDLSAGGFYRTYLDGELFFSHTKPAADGEFALDPAQLLLFADNNNENQPLDIAMAAIFSKSLDDDEIRTLGTAGISLIAPSGNITPTLPAGAAGPLETETGTATAYQFTGQDADGDAVQIQVDWGDGTLSPWNTPAAPGTPRTLSKTWNAPGIYQIAARVRDIHGAMSNWNTVQTVTVTGNLIFDFATPPYLQNLGKTTMVVMAELHDDIPMTLEYGENPALGSEVATESVESGGGTRFIRGILTNLQPGTTYHYRLSINGQAAMQTATFRTAPADWEDFTFGAIGDIQTTNGGVWQADPWEPAKIMLEDMRSRNVSFCLGLGDQAQDGNAYTPTKNSFLNRMCAVFGRHKPFYISWGNHDGSSPSHPLRLAADMPSRWQTAESASTRTPGFGNYWFEHSGVFFVCLEYFTTNNKSDSDPANDLTNGWLDTVLSSPAARNARFRVLAVHVPPYCERWINGNAALRTQLVPRLRQHGVDLCMSGHMHGYERGRINGVQYVISGAGSYLDFGEPLVANWSSSTDDGQWLGGHADIPGYYAKQLTNGVPGTPEPIIGGLFHGYSEITVRDRYLRLDQHGFNADGSYIGVLDSLEIGGSDPGPDSDGDGMRDAWELAHGLDPNDPDDAALDLDGDGQSNAAEWLAGTSPSDQSSVFRSSVAGMSAGNITISWSSVPGKRYRIATSPDLTAWSPVMSGGQALEIPASAGSSTSHSLPTSSERGFFRVEVLR